MEVDWNRSGGWADRRNADFAQSLNHAGGSFGADGVGQAVVVYTGFHRFDTARIAGERVGLGAAAFNADAPFCLVRAVLLWPRHTVAYRIHRRAVLG